MIKSWLVALALAATLLAGRTSAAQQVDFDQGIDVKKVVQTLKDSGAAVTEVAGAPVDKASWWWPFGKAEWTIMVFINAKNNLEAFGLKDVNEMEQVGSTAKVKIAVELGRIEGYDDADSDWKGQRRYIIKKDKDTSKITSPVLQDIPKADMGDWTHLVDFVRWAQKTAPAKHYMLVVWNHGSGWDKKRSQDVVLNGISYDDESGNHISTPGLAKALAAIGKLDIYASDACLMQMAEVGYEIRGYADYIMASEETEPADGYTYDTFLGPVVAKPAMTAAEVARVAAQAYTAHYASINKGATQSVVKAATLPRLLALVSDWTKAVMAANETVAVKSAHEQAQEFYTSANKDLLHFVELVDAASQDAAVKAKGMELESFLAKEVIVSNATTGSRYANAKGLAVYLPNYGYNEDYDTLAWAKDGNWAKFAQWVNDLR